MSFLGLRKTRTPADNADSLRVQEPGSQTPSIRSTGTFRSRLSSLSIFTPKRLRSHVSKKFAGGGVGFTAAREPHSYTPSRSPSPEPSLEIRRPSGLGRRASITGDSGEWWAEEPYPRALGERKRSISTPELSLIFADREPGRGTEHSEHEGGATKPRKATCMLSRIPLDLLKTAVYFVPFSDLPAVALTCKTLLEVARSRLYRNVDLLRVSDEACIDRCFSLLASKREVAVLVETFACKFVPPSHNLGNTSPLPAFTFAIALNNMHNLSSLVLARFDSALLFHTTFRLRRLTFLCETSSQGELEGLFAWLANQPKLTSLSFPHLTLDNESVKWFAAAGSQLANIPEEDQDSQSDSPTMFPSTFLPALDHIAGPAPLVSAIVPGRPLTSVAVHIHITIYDGLRPSALATELTRGSVSVTSFSLVTPRHSRVDARTIERVLMAAGAELGTTLKVLEIETPLEDQVLHKHVHGILPRCHRLHTLRLRRDVSGQDSPTPSLGNLVVFPTASSSSSFLSRPISPSPTPLCMQERSQLVIWSKQCPTLSSVIFPSGGCWRISESLAGPVYTSMGRVKTV
ncbi:uncharacterized protein PHACADRAFT_177993 [Phanerochaete carnosa HHB-10118-sp]|uniref:Uncharacterized protein n=1 Tax=Phanerochaete carnosa (strain HHB-10118-sp) TaxID=650164 RepID=K5VX44_PHACS|nr:uncharacterized protein PHACADRAFT_177993 [Phanerochaete carnosa HHB-10118-sp]EKM51350.1 hypothetical protein PHACADRAFT_177993 [Phanerochaete carnosa HHB-10118-sp]